MKERREKLKIMAYSVRTWCCRLLADLFHLNRPISFPIITQKNTIRHRRFAHNKISNWLSTSLTHILTTAICHICMCIMLPIWMELLGWGLGLEVRPMWKPVKPALFPMTSKGILHKWDCKKAYEKMALYLIWFTTSVETLSFKSSMQDVIHFVNYGAI